MALPIVIPIFYITGLKHILEIVYKCFNLAIINNSLLTSSSTRSTCTFFQLYNNTHYTLYDIRLYVFN